MFYLKKQTFPGITYAVCSKKLEAIIIWVVCTKVVLQLALGNILCLFIALLSI